MRSSWVSLPFELHGIRCRGLALEVEDTVVDPYKVTVGLRQFLQEGKICLVVLHPRHSAHRCFLHRNAQPHFCSDLGDDLAIAQSATRCRTLTAKLAVDGATSQPM